MIFANTQKLLQAKAQKAWKDLADATPATSQPAGTNGATIESAATSAVITLIDPDVREKIRTIQQDAESLTQKLSSGGESNREAAMRKAEDAKRRLKSLRLQAQMAAASGDVRAAARIAREVAQVAKELGHAVKEYGGSGADAAAAIGSVAAAGQQTTATFDSVSAENTTAGSSLSSGTIGDRGGGDTGNGQQRAKEDHPEAVPDEPLADAPGETQSVVVDTLANLRNAAVSPAPEIESKRTAIMKEGAARKAETAFYSDTRGTMAQLRAILEQMKKLAQRYGAVGMVAQMDLASRDMAEGERLLTEAASPGIVALPSGSLVQVSA
jgi:hypothetical protein